MPSSIALLVNPEAGRGRAAQVAAVVQRRLTEAGFSVRSVSGRTAEESLDLARAEVERGVGTLVACGGDGLVHLALQAVAYSPVVLGVVPAGSGDDLARALGIPRDPVAAADVVVASRVREVDLGMAGERYFGCVLSAGFDAVVSERAARLSWPPGQLRYTRATLQTLRSFTPLRYLLDLDGESRQVTAMMVAVANSPSFGGGLRIAEGASLDDGYLDVVVIKEMGKVDLVRTYPRLYRGTHVHHPAYEHHRVRRATVASPGITAFADGEPVGRLPLTVACAPGALRVLVPAP